MNLATLFSWNQTGQKRNLRQFVTKELLQAVIIPFAVVELLLLIIYFTINSYITHKTKETLIMNVQNDLRELSKHVAASFDIRLSKIEQLAEIFRREHERLFRHPDHFLLISEPKFIHAANGALIQQNRGETSLYYSTITPHTPEQIAKARLTAALDPLYRTIKEADPLVAAVYLNTYDSMNRYYPFMENAAQQYGPDLNATLFNFYYEADATHNPKRQVVWTDVYLDPAGLGWMASCIAPVYRGDFLEGVVGLDITIQTFIDQIHALSLPWDANVFLLDRTGTILAMQPKVEKILGIKEHKIDNYTNVTTVTKKPAELNLKSTPNLATREAMKEIFRGKELFETSLGGRNYVAFTRTIPRTRWQLVALVDKETLYAPVNNLASLARTIGYIAIGFMILFYILFLGYLIQRSRTIAAHIATPIEELAHATTIMHERQEIVNIPKGGIAEIDQLIDDFTAMTVHLSHLYRSMQQEIED
ncbi:MAG: cache domain-containing protein, partial [Campylobacterales bacterium]